MGWIYDFSVLFYDWVLTSPLPENIGSGKNLMQTSKTIILACLILLFAVTINLLMEQDPLSDAKPVFGRNDPDFYMLNADITQYRESGFRHHKIKAERLTHYPLTHLTILKTPNMILYPTGGEEQPWDITAKNGRWLDKALLREERLDLWDQVIAVQKDDLGKFIYIQTHSLTIYPDKDYAETDQKVYIDDNTGRTIASGMRAFFEDGRFYFFSSPEQRVQTILLPEFTYEE